MAKLTFEQMLEQSKVAGTSRHNPQRHIEENLQIACCRWFQYQWGNFTINGEKIGALLHHSPNGGKRNLFEAKRFKAMGTRAGFPDLWLGIPVDGCPYLCIELKTTESGSRQSEHQRNYESLVKAVGAKYIVVRTLQEFIQAVNDYLAPLTSKK